MARQKAAAAPFPVELLKRDAERIPLADGVDRYRRHHLVAVLDRESCDALGRCTVC